MICFYHNDLDGRCSAAIVLRALKNGQAIELAYGRPIPTDIVAHGEKIVIVDYSVPPETMRIFLERTNDITWIDHHQSALRINYPIKPAGTLSLEKAACELTWDFFYPGKPAPEAVLLTGDKDIWTWRYGQRTALFNEGIRIHDARPESALWDKLLENDKNLMEQIIVQGEICVKYRNAFCADYVRQFGYEVEFAGLRGIAVALQYFGSDTFGPLMDGYDIGITFAFTGMNWAISLFSHEADVGKIAEHYGGGGHKLAAGFLCETLPFRHTGKPALQQQIKPE